MGKAKPKAAKKGGGLQLVGMVAASVVTLVLLGVGASMMSSTPPPKPKPKAAAAAAASGLYDLAATTMSGEELSIGGLAGKTVLMLNVASK